MIVALFDRVIISPEKLGEKMAGNILIPDMGHDLANIGTVVDVGPDCKYLQPGDKVIMLKVGPVKFTYDDQDFLLTAEKEILAKIK